MTLNLILGPMTSGKTTELLFNAKKKASAKASVLYCNSKQDKRNERMFSTHNDQLAEEQKQIEMVKVNTLKEVDVSKYDYIFVDEGQFYSDINKIVRDWVIRKKKHVTVAALTGDVDLELFGDTHLLLPLCTAKGIKILESHCMKCIAEGVAWEHAIASYTKLRGEDDRIGKYKSGGSDIYEAVCLQHHPKSQE